MRAMRKFIKRVSVFSLLVLILFSLLNTAYIHTNTYYKENYDVGRFSSVPYNIDILNIGSSHGYCSFYWEDYPKMRSFNFSMPAQHYEMDYAILRQYLSHISRGAVVILPISYFQITNYAPMSSDCSKLYYYRFISPSFFPKWNIIDALKYFVSASGKNLLEICTAIFHDVPESEVPQHAYSGEREINGEILSSKTQDEILNEALEDFKDWTAKRGSEKEYKKNIQAVQNILNLCYENGFTPVLVSTPMSNVLTSVYDKEWPEFASGRGGIFARFTKEIVDKNKGLVYLDYSRDGEFTSHDLFLDCHHLCPRGGKKFTARILRDMAQRGIAIKGYQQ